MVGSPGLRQPNALALTPIGLVLIIWGVVLTAVSIGDTGDTPCGALVDPSFSDPFNTRNLCGIIHVGMATVVLGLVIGGYIVLVVAVLAARGRMSARFATIELFALTSVAAITWLFLAWRTSYWGDDFHLRAWTPLRNLAGVTAGGLLIATVASAAITLPRRGSH